MSSPETEIFEKDPMRLVENSCNKNMKIILYKQFLFTLFFFFLYFGNVFFSTGFERPTFDSRCKIFELDPCDAYGKVCLVYKESKTGKVNLGMDIILYV